MRRRVVIIFVASIMLVMVGGVVMCRMCKAEISVKGHMRPEDIPLIKRSVELARWDVASDCLEQHLFKIFFVGCLPDLALGHVCEVAPAPDRQIDGFGREDDYFSSRAFAVSRTCLSSRGVRYELQHTNNNWEVIIFAIEN